MGYWVVASDAPNQHYRGVVLFYQESPHFAVEVDQKNGPKFSASICQQGISSGSQLDSNWYETTTPSLRALLEPWCSTPVGPL